MSITAGSLVKGKEYKVKYEGDKRFSTMTYSKDMYALDYDFGSVGPVAVFESRAGVKFYPYNLIIEAVEVDATKAKKKKPKVCPKCYGNKRFEHLSHIDAGVCYKCMGAGEV